MAAIASDELCGKDRLAHLEFKLVLKADSYLLILLLPL